MKILPVRRIKRPAYPTQTQLDQHADLLRLTPRRWQRRALFTAAFTTLCSLAQLPGHLAKSNSLSKVAPVFKHGDGDTMAVAGTTFFISPVLLPEDEACYIINQQLLKAGFRITEDKLPAYDVTITLTDPQSKKESAIQTRIIMDGVDHDRLFSYEYLGAEDRTRIGLNEWQSLSQQVAALQKGLAEAEPPGITAVFYDPGVRVTEGMLRENNPLAGMKPSGVFSEAHTLMPLFLYNGRNRGTHMEYERDGNTVTLRNDEKVVVATIGSAEATINGENVLLPSPVIEQDGVVLAPIRQISEGLDFKLHTDGGMLRLIGNAVIYEQDKVEDAWVRNGKKRFHLMTFTSSIYQYEIGDDLNSYAFAYDGHASRSLAKESSRRQLRQQVQDFLAWLLAEGWQ